MSTPEHIAIIMDGNGRWASRRRRPRLEGHRAGLKSIRRVMEACEDLDVRVLSLYAFSTENWTRPRAEVAGLMRLFAETIDREVGELHERGIQVRVTGRRDALSPRLLKRVEWAEALTRGNQQRVLNVLINYGGRAEIVDAVRSLLRQGATAEQLDEAAISGAMYCPDLPEPALVIRTAGEQRISNFLIWETAYAEFYSTDTLWPDFGVDDLRQALAEYARRERKYGGLTPGVAPAGGGRG